MKHACLKRFAYGQTGAGKTHTMYGSDSAPGLVPRAAEELFGVLGRYAHECSAKVVCSMFELYRDELVDLLFVKAKGKAPAVLDIKKDVRGTVKAGGLRRPSDAFGSGGERGGDRGRQPCGPSEGHPERHGAAPRRWAPAKRGLREAVYVRSRPRK